MGSLRSWDLATGRPIALHANVVPGEILLATMKAPVLGGGGGPMLRGGPRPLIIEPPPPAPPVFSGNVAIDVWGCDRRVALVESHYFRRCDWYAALVATGLYDPGHALTGAEGEGLTVTVQAVGIVKDSRGQIHEMGPLPSAEWLNFGTAPDGIEIVSGIRGIRFKWAIAVNNPTGITPDMSPSWELVCNVEVKPDTRIGCGEVVAEVAEGFSLDKPIVLILDATTGNPG